MSKLNRVLGGLALFFTCTLIGAIIIVSIYGAANYQNIIIDMDDVEIGFPSETKTIEDTFTLASKFEISTAIAHVRFHQEEREDILVKYTYSKPLSPLYKLNYTANQSGDKITLLETLKSTGISFGTNNDNSLDIYVPMDYTPEILTVQTDVVSILDESIIPTTSELTLKSDVSEINVTIDFPLDQFTATSDVGKVEINLNKSIDQAIIKSEVGKVSVKSVGEINQLELSSNVGAVYLSSTGYIGKSKITSEVGKVTAELSEPGDSFDIRSNVGAVEVTLEEAPENFAIFAKSDVGSVNTDYLITKKDSHPYKATSEVGSVSVQ